MCALCLPCNRHETCQGRTSPLAAIGSSFPKTLRIVNGCMDVIQGKKYRLVPLLLRTDKQAYAPYIFPLRPQLHSPSLRDTRKTPIMTFLFPGRRLCNGPPLALQSTKPPSVFKQRRSLVVFHQTPIFWCVLLLNLVQTDRVFGLMICFNMRIDVPLIKTITHFCKSLWRRMSDCFKFNYPIFVLRPAFFCS